MRSICRFRLREMKRVRYSALKFARHTIRSLPDRVAIRRGPMATVIPVGTWNGTSRFFSGMTYPYALRDVALRGTRREKRGRGGTKGWWWWWWWRAPLFPCGVVHSRRGGVFVSVFVKGG